MSNEYIELSIEIPGRSISEIEYLLEAIEMGVATEATEQDIELYLINWEDML